MKEQMKLGGKISKKDLYKTALKFEGKTSDEIAEMFPGLPEHYLVAAQASLIIVQGIMEGADISVMHIEDAYPTDYIAMDERFWS